MDGDEVKIIREKLGLTREEFAEFLCLSGYQSITNIETGFRQPGKFASKILRHLEAIPRSKAIDLIKEINKHDVQ
jgi:DNA-binding transcriptional regulator YiaG